MASRTELLRTLIDCDQQQAQPSLPAELRKLYDGELQFPPSDRGTPYVIGNFVSTLDGVVSYKIKGQSSGSPISGSDPGDRFIMGLLRASADAVMVGAGTVHDTSPKASGFPSTHILTPGNSTPSTGCTGCTNPSTRWS